MTFSDETLAAYADGELDPGARADIDEAARIDPSIAQRIERHRALRANLQAAYAAELGEPVPDRLLASLRSPASEPPSSAKKTRTSWRATAPATHWRYSLAASVLLALGVALLAWRHSRPWRDIGDGTLVAQGSLAPALSDQLSGEAAAGSPLRIGLSFAAKSGDYCRTFFLSGSAGLACRHAERWEILALAKQRSEAVSDPQFRTAGSPLPATVLAAIEDQISGEPLDRNAEIAARDKKWSKPSRR